MVSGMSVGGEGKKNGPLGPARTTGFGPVRRYVLERSIYKQRTFPADGVHEQRTAPGSRI